MEDCRKSGISAFAETLEEFLRNTHHRQKRFDFICAFHCLEHVAKPLDLLKASLPLMHETTSLFFSTPYSPMSFETNWHDPLNYPPHHMTRWNAAAYRQLAAQAGLSVELLMPQPQSPAIRALTANQLSVNGAGSGPPGFRKAVVAAIFHPLKFAAQLRAQKAREKIAGTFAADVVLAHFTLNQVHGR